MTLYEILEVAPQASPEVIQVSWKALQKRYHPDGSHPNSERSKAINQAHDVLIDSAKRRQYDAWLKQQKMQVIPRAKNKKVATPRQAVHDRPSLLDDFLHLVDRVIDEFAPETPVRITKRTRRRR